MLADRENDVFVSVVSLLEIAIKNTARNRDPMPFSASVARFRFTEFDYAWLGLELAHVVAIEAFQLVGGDPFDRLLVAQARVAELQLVTHDREVADRLEDVVYF
jgi:PIN domain nuclease of toxin-antitoxin system